MRIAPRRYGDVAELGELERRLAASPDDVDLRFEQACALEDLGRTEDALAAYVGVLRLDARHLGTLTNLGSMLLSRGDPERALTFFTQALVHHPLAPLTHVNLGQAMLELGDVNGAIAHQRAALAHDPAFFAAHFTLTALYERTGEVALAAHHRERAYAGGASWTLPYRGSTPPALRLLLVVAGSGGDLVMHRFLDDRAIETTMLLADGYRAGTPLPAHDVLFNAIGDADRARATLERARAVFDASDAPAINLPARVLATDRVAIATRCGAIPGAIAPRIERIPRAAMTAAALAERGWTFPLLVRAPGYQEGRHFERVETADELTPALARMRADELFAIAFADVRGADGFVRKYRVLFVDGRIYPVHLAVSAEWKVHYFSADMATRADHRDEERAFLADPRAAIGARAYGVLAAIERELGLEYAGVDFALDASGDVVVFEANATMAVYPPPPGEAWAYRQPAADAVVAAVRAMLAARAEVSRPVRA